MIDGASLGCVTKVGCETMADGPWGVSGFVEGDKVGN